MAITRTRKFPFASLSSFNALLPDFARCEDKFLKFNGQPVEMHLIVNNSSTVDYELVTGFKKVLHGILYNETDDAAVTDVVITPKAGTPGTAVLTGTLTASKNYLVLIIGTNE